jgi:CheY-like chemotaxis protein
LFVPEPGFRFISQLRMVIQFDSGDDDGRAESKSPAAVSSEAAGAVPKRIVVVEDERVTQTVISVILKGAGYSVVTARDAAEALSVIRAEIPHLMTLDIDLSRDASGPTWDGYHVVEWLRHRFPEEPVPFIVISGGEPAAIQAKAQSLGAFGYLPKPVDKQKLLGLVREAIGEAPPPAAPTGGGAPPPLPPRPTRPPGS